MNKQYFYLGKHFDCSKVKSVGYSLDHRQSAEKTFTVIKGTFSFIGTLKA
jgi:hypothetical protein